MRVFFLIDTPLAGETACSVAQRLLQEKGHSEFIAFIMQPGYFHDRYKYLLDKLANVINVTVKSERDFPKFSRVKILQTIEPDIYVTIDDIDPLEVDFLIAAKYLNLPTLRIDPGIISEITFTWRNLNIVLNLFTRFNTILNDYRLIWETLGETDRGYWSRIYFILSHLYKRFRREYGLLCDKVAVSGEFARNLLIKKGISPDRIVVTGLPRFDTIMDESIIDDKFIEQLGLLSQGKKVILYLPDSAAEHKFVSHRVQARTTYCVINSCKQIPEVLLVIKPHPGENPELYNSIIEKLDSEALVYRGTNLHDLIRNSAAVITGISTTGLETLALNKPLINISLHTKGSYLPSNFEYIPYISSGVALGVHHLDELPDVIRTALYDEETTKSLLARSRDFVYHHLYKLDGRSSERVAHLILEMSKSSSTDARQ